MTQPDPREKFHIHIDAERIDAGLADALLHKRGFSEKNFIREGQRGSEYSPNVHITRKYLDKTTFNVDFDFILAEVARGPALDGYVEGEYISLDRSFAFKPRTTAPQAPFCVDLGSLPPSTFRQTELHLTVDAASDPVMLEALFGMGFFCAYAPKDYGPAQIFTMQGSVRDIARITPHLIDFVEQGGLAHARLKEERIVRWWVSDESVVLPPVIQNIHLAEQEVENVLLCPA
jgi:hypothetical protein